MADRLPPVITNRVRGFFKDDLDGLLAAGEAIESLQAHPGWVLVQSLIAAENDAALARLDGGYEPLSQAEYALEHGRRFGLQHAGAVALAVQDAAADAREKQHRFERGAESSREG